MTNSVSAPPTWFPYPHPSLPSPQSHREGVGKTLITAGTWCSAVSSVAHASCCCAAAACSKCCLSHVAAELSPTKLTASPVLLQPQSLGTLARWDLNVLSFSFFPLSGIHLQTALLLSPGKRCLAPSFLLLASAVI